MLHSDPAKRQYSYSALASWMTCQRKWYWGYVRGLTPIAVAAAPGFGSAIHAGLHRWFDTHDQEAMLAAFREEMVGAPADVLRTLEKGELILKGYVRQWATDPFKVLANEVEFSLPMPDGSTLIGRIDRVIEWEGRILAKETKTTSGGIGGHYFKQFTPNLQIDIECYAVAKDPRWGRCDGALIDAVQVCKTKEGYARDVQDRTPDDLARFEARYARIVADIERAAQGATPDHDGREGYLQNQLMCTYYGECPYYRLCRYNNDGLIEGHYQPRHVEEPTPEGP